MKNRWHCYFANHYDGFMSAVERRSLAAIRGHLLKGLSGRVLEIGSGTGVNVPFLSSPGGLTMLTEPDSAMRAVMTRKFPALASNGLPLVACTAERLPLQPDSFDAVVATLVLCSVRDPETACAEIRRVLRPGGRLFFIEHVRGAGRRAKWQDRLQPWWTAVGCGCHPNRKTVSLIESAGLRLLEVDYFDPFAGSPWLLRAIGGIVRPFVRGIAVNEAFSS